MCLPTWLQDITLSDILTIIAIISSPIVALWLQKKIENRANQKERKLNIFKTLMATRANIVDFEHVKALNMIDIEFYNNRVITSTWEVYRDHLNSYPKDGADAEKAVWNKSVTEYLAKLLFEMAKFLGYDFNEVLLKKGAYAPLVHGALNVEQALIRRGCVELLNGAKTLKVELATPKKSENQNRPGI